MHVAWNINTLKEKILHEPLLIEVGSPGKDNILVQKGLLNKGELIDCELFYGVCNLTKCFCCQRHGHIAKQCQSKLACGYCAKEHDTRSCPSSNSTQDNSCSNCKGKHTTLPSFCPERQARVSKAAAAYTTQPLLYMIQAKSSTSLSPPPSPPCQHPSLQPPH